MNEEERRAVVQRYLDALHGELKDLPASQRRGLVEDVRSHIDEAWAASTDRNHASLLNILERLGDPAALAAEERERLGLPVVQEQGGPGLLEIAAVVLTVLFWPVGVLLAWLSPRWSGIDKVVATALPVLGLGLLLLTSFAAVATFTSGPVVVRSVEVATQNVEPAPSQASGPQEVVPAAPRPEAQQLPERPATTGFSRLAIPLNLVLVLFGFVGAPICSAVYLALRVGPSPRRAAILLPAGAVLAIAVALAAFLLPLSA